MECDFTTWVTNCSPAAGFLIVWAPFLSDISVLVPVASPLGETDFAGILPGREGVQRSTPSLPGILLARRPPSAVLYRTPNRVEGHDDTRCYLRIGHLLASSLLTGEQ